MLQSYVRLATVSKTGTMETYWYFDCHETANPMGVFLFFTKLLASVPMSMSTFLATPCIKGRNLCKYFTLRRHLESNMSKMLVLLFGIAFLGSALSSPVLKSDSLHDVQKGPVRVSEDLLRALIALQPINEPETELEPKRTPPSDNGPNCQCGVKGPSTRIVGGGVAGVKEWPWQAYLLINDTDLCGGTVINRNWVLTAAHCTANAKKVMVYLGIHNIDDDTAKHISQASVIINHENYLDKDDNTQENDISLLKLKKPIPAFNSFIQPVCLPYSFTETNFDGELATVTGWGHTKENGTTADKLKELTLPVLDSTTCAKKPYLYETGTITNDMLCTYKKGQDACQGDSGGPLNWQSSDSTRVYQIGVVSFGEGCARRNYPNVYMKVGNYLNWIHKKTGQRFCIPSD